MSEFISLYSGSSGNCSVVRTGEKYIIIDMGKGVRTTSAALKELGLNISDCAGILVTHEHSDHVKGLATFLKKNPLPVYGADDTLASRKSSVAAAPYTGSGFFFRKVESPLTWSLCSWVTRMPAQSLMASPSDLSAAVVVRTPLPISTIRYCAPQRTTLLLPEEPE